MQVKTEIVNYLKHLVDDFPLNAKFIYEEAFLVVENNSRLNCITYFVREIAAAYRVIQTQPSVGH